MSEVYYAMIIFPLIFFITLAFIFTSSIAEIKVQQLRINCPYPIYQGVATNVTIVNEVQVNYKTPIPNDGSSQNKNGTRFFCFNGNEGLQLPIALTVSTRIIPYGETLFSNLAFGWFAFVADTITDAFFKLEAIGRILYLMVTAPAQVTGLAFFSYINILLITFIALGSFMVVRG